MHASSQYHRRSGSGIRTAAKRGLLGLIPVLMVGCQEPGLVMDPGERPLPEGATVAGDLASHIGGGGIGIQSLAAEVTPVLARTFNASTQNWSDQRAAWNQRSDLVPLVVTVWNAVTGEPIQGAGVQISLVPIEGSGGHPHPGRPAGTLFLPEENAQTQGRVRSTLSMVTDEEGRAPFVFRTSGVSGDEDVRVVVTWQGQQNLLGATVRVRWPGLTAMARSAPRHYFTPQGHTIHGDINHYIAPGFGAAVEALFATYFETRDEPRFQGGETRFAITEGTLPWGGLFDINPWRPPHRTHRTGVDMDVRYWSLSAQQRAAFEALCRRTTVLCEVHANVQGADRNNPQQWHYHLRTEG